MAAKRIHLSRWPYFQYWRTDVRIWQSRHYAVWPRPVIDYGGGHEMAGIRRQRGWLISSGMLLAFYSMALEPPAGVIAAAGTKPAQLCGRALLLHTSNTNPWRSNV